MNSAVRCATAAVMGFGRLTDKALPQLPAGPLVAGHRFACCGKGVPAKEPSQKGDKPKGIAPGTPKYQ